MVTKLILDLATLTGIPVIYWATGLAVLCTTILCSMKSVETPDIRLPK